MSSTTEHSKNRILIIDDNVAIHEDFRKILQNGSGTNSSLDDAKAALFGAPSDAAPSQQHSFDIDSAYQGQEGLEKIRQASAEGHPYSMAFVDVRMPPGWDGVDTIKNVWKEYPDFQAVICTAYSDYSWDEMTRHFDNSDNILILKKPFDNVEALQMAHALTKKWQLGQEARKHLEELDTLVSQRTAELRKANEVLQTEMRERRAANEHLQNEIQERSEAEEALRRSEERFSKAFHASPIPMVIQHRNEGRNLDVNDSFLRMTGYVREEILGDDSSSLCIWKDPKTASHIRSELECDRRVRDHSCSVNTKSGETRDCLVSAERFDLGTENYLLIIIQDVTERLELEHQLRQAQKMEAVGQLAAGVAHDFNNLLTVILGNSTYHLNDKGLNQELEKSLRQVSSAAKRATELTSQLLAYSRKQMIQRKALDINKIITNTSGMLRRLIGENIELVCDLEPKLPRVLADSNNIDQIILNFCVNARDAMPDGGHLTLQTNTVEITQDDLHHNAEARVGHFVRLNAQDTGSGIDSADLNRIFEPFFTTKEVGEGSGMGLSMVYGIVKQHEGWINVSSEVGKGTTFSVYLPIAQSLDEVTKHFHKPIENLTCDSGNRTILVVEDEALVREFVAEVLRNQGYTIITASNGVEAQKTWADNKEQVDLLMTDMVMPESISGREIAQQFLAEKPDLKVIFTSGYSKESIGSEASDFDHAFLPKPYPTQKLLETVSTCFTKA